MRMLITVTDGLGPPLALAESKLIFWRGGKGGLEGAGNHLWLSSYIVGNCAEGLCSLPSSLFHSDANNIWY